MSNFLSVCFAPFFCLCFFATPLFAQQPFDVFGQVRNEFDEPVRTSLEILDLDGTKINHTPFRSGKDGSFKCGACLTTTNLTRTFQIRISKPGGEDPVTVETEIYRDQPLLLYYEETSFKSVLDRAEPRLRITAAQLAATGHNTLDQALQFLLPSFFATYQTIADGTDHIVPISLNGLGPDQVLIAINGKRRHVSPQLNVNGTFGRGAVSSDLAIIPLESVLEVEVLKTAASVKYGSDAIAGIINIKTKETKATAFGVQYGAYPYAMRSARRWLSDRERTGLNEQEAKIWGTLDGKIGRKGTLFLAGDLTQLGAINRSGDYTGSVFTRTDSILGNDLFWSETGYNGRKTMRAGRAGLQQAAMHFNINMPITADERLKFYGFGGFSFKTGDATGFYRFPKDSSRMVYALYPNGFSPRILSRIADNFFTTGFTMKNNLGEFDLSYTRGGGVFGFYVENSNNAELGTLSPQNFYSGSLIYRQNTSSLRWRTKTIRERRKGAPSKFSLFMDSGLEVRNENFAIIAGDDASWFDDPNQQKEPGAQVFPGFGPESEIERERINIGMFLEPNLVFKLPKNFNLLLKPGARYETFTIAPGALISKFAVSLLNYDIGLNIHGSYNGGYRAPSLHQIYYSNIGIQLPFRVATVNNESLTARNFGIPTLMPEFSNTFNTGVSFGRDTAWRLGLDYTYIRLKDRIVLSGFFDAVDSRGQPTEFASKFIGINAQRAQFFNNYPNTKTHTVEFTANGKIGDKTDLWAGLNWNRTTVDRDTTKLPKLLQKHERTLFNREEESRLASNIPRWKAIFSIQGHFGDTSSTVFPWRFAATVFGDNQYTYPDTSAFLYNRNGENVLDVRYKNATIPMIDVEIGINLKSKKGRVLLSLGCNNLLGFRSNPIKKPDVSGLSPKAAEAAMNAWRDRVSFNGVFEYSRRVQTFGVGGAMPYLKIRYFLDKHRIR